MHNILPHSGRVYLKRFKKLMTRNEKIIMGILIFGILVFIILSAVLLFGKGKMSSPQTATVTPVLRKNTEPYPTIPPIKDMTVMVNERRFNPQIVTIKAGNLISFFNIGDGPMTIEGVDTDMTSLNFTVAESDTHEIRFSTPGKYTYRVKGKPTQIGTIIIE